jgi:hypothetical protein
MKTADRKLHEADIERAMISPSAVFDSPSEIVASPGLSEKLKIELLQRWAVDAHALQRASDENMSGGESPRLDEINAALTKLDPKGRTPDIFERGASKI